MNKNIDEIALELTKAMLEHNSKVSVHMGNTSTTGEIISAEDVAKAYLLFKETVFNLKVPDSNSETT